MLFRHFTSACRARRFTLLLVIVLASCGILTAQEVTGTILGTVTDSSGAVVAGATVTITNTDRNAVIRVVKTNRGGEYSAPQLTIGKYTVSVEESGFKKVSELGITLNVNDKLTFNEVLPIGAASETVSVQANPLQVDT